LQIDEMPWPGGALLSPSASSVLYIALLERPPVSRQNSFRFWRRSIPVGAAGYGLLPIIPSRECVEVVAIDAIRVGEVHPLVAGPILRVVPGRRHSQAGRLGGSIAPVAYRRAGRMERRKAPGLGDILKMSHGSRARRSIHHRLQVITCQDLRDAKTSSIVRRKFSVLYCVETSAPCFT